MRSFGILLAVGLVAWVSDVQAGPRHCGHCGCRQECNKVCRLVCGTKTETNTEYCCECEDFCVPGPSRMCGVQCDCDAQGHKCQHTIWQPTCAKVRTRKILVKKEISKEVPDYKWVVEELCHGCGHCLCRTQQGAELAPASDQVAPKPGVDEAEPGPEPALDETEPVGHESSRAQPRRPSRFLQVLLGVK